MQQTAQLLLVLVLGALALLQPAASAPHANHPDLAGLLALKATICGNCSELSSWSPAGEPCISFDGVYCGWVHGAWRVVGVQLQLQDHVVSFNDSAMSPGGVLAGLSHLRELEVLCVKPRPPPPSPGPPQPAPTPTNHLRKQQQKQRQQQQTPTELVSFRQQLQQDPAAAEQQGLFLSRWLARTAPSADDDQHSPQLHSPQLDLHHHQQQQQQWGQQPVAAAGEFPWSWFAAFPRLTHLRVVGCGAAGELRGAAAAGAQHLASLVLNHNRLTGTLPDEIARLKGLSVLDLSSNQLSGSLPLSWVALQQLHYLYLNSNNLTGTLPCEYTQLQLLLADLSGNRWHSSPIGGDMGCQPHLVTTPPWGDTWDVAAVAAATAETGSSELGMVESHDSRQQGQGAVSHSSSDSRRRSRQLGQHVASVGAGGVLTAPRCWLRHYCYDEGAFICLQRQAKAAAGGCSQYVYGASDLHIDALNQCDHGGTHLVAIGGMFSAFVAALLLIWLHHCRVMRWMSQPGSSSSSPQPPHQQQPQQHSGPWQQRQWLISGPSPSSRSRARSISGGTGAATIHSSSSGSISGGAAGGGGLREPLLQQAPPTLPLLYHPATAEHEGAGYSSPHSSSSAADFIDATAVGTPDGLLPSALTTPSAGAISIRPQGPLLAGFGARGGSSGGSGGSSGAAQGSGRRRGRDKGLAAAAAAAGAGGRGGGSRTGGNGAAAAAASERQVAAAAAAASGYDSDSSSGTPRPAAADGRRTTAHLSAHWLKPEYYFQGNEPLPPWAGGVARMLAATLAPPDGAGGDGRGGTGCFSCALLLPLVFLLADTVTNLRLLLLWGVGPPPAVKLWPSYALLGLLCVPHVLVGAVVHFRLLAVACLPPALKAATIREDQLAEDMILPPGAGAVVKLYSWLFAAPAWLAYPLILLLLGPGVVLLTLLCPLVLLLACCGLSSLGGVVRYIQLLQGCAALTQSSGSAVLLTVLFLMGNLPLEWAFLDSSLYYLTVAADLANIAVAWSLRLQAVRRQQALALAALPAATGQRWT